MTEDQKEVIESMKGRMKFLYWDAMDFRREFPDRLKESDEMLHWIDTIWFWLLKTEKASVDSQA